MRLKSLVVFIICCLLACSSWSQEVGIKTNALYWLTTTPNVGLEYRASEHLTLSADLGYNAFKFPNSWGEGENPNPKLHHWLFRPEVKYWFCRPFERSFLGVHALYGNYNAGGIKFIKFMKNARFDGYGVGGGISYGYQWAWGNRLGIEASLGLGYIYLQYDKYNCGNCGKKLGRFNRHYVGPTKAALSLIYYIR